jgi:probable blue pigment (indigoidine) exporter
MSSSSLSRSTLASLTLAALSWGVGTAISKQAVAEIPPLTLLPVQLGASLILLLVLLLARRQPIRLPRDAPAALGWLGVLNPGVAYALSLLGLVTVSASLSVVIWALEPILILFLAAWLLGERVGWIVGLLSGVAVAGVLVVVGRPAGSAELVGVVLTVAGIGCCAVYTVATRRWIGSAPQTAAIVVTQEAYALAFAVALAAAAWLVGGDGVPQASPIGWMSAIASGVLYYGAAYWFYLSGLRQAPAPIAAVSFYLIPVFGIAASYLLLGERLAPTQLVAAGVVVVAVAVILTRSARVSSPAIVTA